MKQKCSVCGFVGGSCDFSARLGGRYFSTPWTRYSLNTDGRTQNLESNMEDDALENSVTSNIENLVLLYLELLIIEMEVVVDPCPCCSAERTYFLYINVTHPHRTGRGCYHRARPSERDGRQDQDKIVCRHSLGSPLHAYCPPSPHRRKGAVYKQTLANLLRVPVPCFPATYYSVMVLVHNFM